MVTTADFPQADRLAQVGQVAMAIADGNHNDEGIESFIGLDSAGRQGRYYRLAAEILGLISNQHNYSVLTPSGEEFSKLKSDGARMDFLAQRLVETPVFQEALRYIHEHKPNDKQLKLWFRAFYPGAENTADRRFHTFISYLRDAGLLKHSKTNNSLKKYVGSIVKQKTPPLEGLAGRKVRPSMPDPTKVTTKGIISIDLDLQKRERANQTHWKLVDAKALFLNDRGFEPYENVHIDLYAAAKEDFIIYEMKSVNQDDKNLLSQIRKAISQLYEYRYIYAEPDARLSIVTNCKITNSDKWILDYLAKDRGIAYEWTEDFSNFKCSSAAASLLENFAP